jgi:hypothetical protein
VWRPGRLQHWVSHGRDHLPPRLLLVLLVLLVHQVLWRQGR